MALNIKNDEAQRLSRELADLTGETVTRAVTLAVRERLARLRAAAGGEDARARDIRELGRQIAAALPSDTFTVEDLYDNRGLPA